MYPSRGVEALRDHRRTLLAEGRRSERRDAGAKGVGFLSGGLQRVAALTTRSAGRLPSGRVQTLGEVNASGNGILGNAVFANGGLGIDLVGGTENAAGVTANDPGDGDSGANGLQNRPVLLSATSKPSSVRGRLNSLPNGVYLIRLYSNPTGSEGARVVGVDSLTADASGDATFNSPVGAIMRGHRITATAADLATGDTSEFSLPRKVERR